MLAAMSRRAGAGFSLVEGLVVVAILGILLAVAVPSLADYVHKKRLEGIADELVSDVALMRAESVSKTAEKAQAFLQIGNGNEFRCYSIFISDALSGTTCDCLKPAGSACTAGYRLNPEIKTVALPASLGIRFSTNVPTNRMRMEAGIRQGGAFRVAIEGSRPGKLRVDFDPSGRATRCTPDGQLAGYPTCP